MRMLLNSFWEFVDLIPQLKFMDIVDILVVAFLIYKGIGLIRTTSASRIARSIILILLISWITKVLQMHALSYVLGLVLELGGFALIIIFQPELRRALERIGGRKFKDWITLRGRTTADQQVIAQTVQACELMSKQKVGALIVFERNTSLEDYFKTGTIIDARVSEQLLCNIFFPKAALHDGALVIRSERAMAAGCVLPLTENTRLSPDLGTRHRAGIGMSELSDAVVVIVSEETGTISVAISGMLKRHLAPQTLQRLLEQELTPETDEGGSLFDKLRKRLAGGGKRA